MAFAKACKILAGQPSPRFLRIAPFSLSTISSRKKSARELRQRRSDYRCCIPALAGFVSPQSIAPDGRSEEHTSELQSPCNLVCRLLLEKKKKKTIYLSYVNKKNKKF